MRNFPFNYKRMTAGNQHSENNNEQENATIEQKTNKKQSVKTVPCNGECFKAVYPG